MSVASESESSDGRARRSWDRSDVGQETALQHRAASAATNFLRGKTRATPTPTSRGRRCSNALHRAATSVRRRQPAVADEQLSYSSDVPEPRSASDGGEETTESAVVG